MKPTHTNPNDDYRPSESKNSDLHSKKSRDSFKMELGWIRSKEETDDLDYERLLNE